MPLQKGMVDMHTHCFVQPTGAKQCIALQCLEPWLNNMPDPDVIAEGLTDLDTWLAGTLTPTVTLVNNALTAYQVSCYMGCAINCLSSLVMRR